MVRFTGLVGSGIGIPHLPRSPQNPLAAPLQHQKLRGAGYNLLLDHEIAVQ